MEDYATTNADMDIKAWDPYVGRTAVGLGATMAPFAQRKNLTAEERVVPHARDAPDARDAAGEGARDARDARAAQQSTAEAARIGTELCATPNAARATRMSGVVLAPQDALLG